MGSAYQSIQFLRQENNNWITKQSNVIVEMPVSLTVNGEAWLTFLCTPTNIDALAVGFLFNEDFIHSLDEIADIRVCPTLENVDIWTRIHLEKPVNWRLTSGCTGGITSQVQTPSHYDKLPDPVEISVSAEQVQSLIEELTNSQDLYKQSGGVHMSLLTDGSGKSLVAEDIGQQNTLDKIAGRIILEQIQFDQKILLTTGRISSEMMQKAIMVGATIAISRTSPSSLSIQLAEDNNITLIGYARPNSFNVYSHPERILQGSLHAI